MNQLIFNLCLIKAELVLSKVKYQYPLCSNAYNGDPPAPNASESTGDVLSAFLNYFPALMQSYRSETLPTEQSNLAAAQATSGPYQELLTGLAEKFYPRLNKLGQTTDASNRLATANTDVNILSGPGKDLAREYKNIDQELNPEYYNSRSLASKKLAELLGSVDLNNANPEAERLVNQDNIRTGNLGNTSATNTVGNALSFGNEKLKRQAVLSDAIGQATNFASAANNTQFNPATASLGKPTSNTGLSQFGGVTKPGDQSFTSGQGFLNNISGFQENAMNINANRRDVLDKLNETTTAIGSL